MSKPRPSRVGTREFLWNIRTADIAFMRPAEAEFAVDGSSDCGAIHRQPQAKLKSPRKRSARN